MRRVGCEIPSLVTMTNEIIPENSYPADDAPREEFLYCHQSALLREQMTTDPKQIPGYDQYGHFPIWIHDLLNHRLVGGGYTLDAVDDAMASVAGEEYANQYDIVELNLSAQEQALADESRTRAKDLFALDEASIRGVAN